MKAILEALRKEVSQINAGIPDPNLTRCDMYRHNKELEMPLLKQRFHLNGLKVFRNFRQKRSLELRRDRYKFGINKIIRERVRTCLIAGTLFIPKHQSGHHYSFLITTNLRIQDLVLEFIIIN